MKIQHPFSKKELQKCYIDSDIFIPKYKSTLKINTDLQISFLKEKPNWWFRIWQKLFLGFEWEDYFNESL